MPDAPEIRLDRLADAMGLTKSEVRSWIESTCAIEYSVSRIGLPVGREPEDGDRRVVRPFERGAVFLVAESVILGEPEMTLEALRSETEVQEPYLESLVARVLAWRFDLDPSVVLASIGHLKIVVSAPTVGASRRTTDGRVVFRDGAEKRNAIALLRALEAAAHEIRGRLVAILGSSDEGTGVRDEPSLLSGHPWLDVVPRDIWASLLQFEFGGGLAELFTAVDTATVGTRDEHKRNAAVIARLVWERSGREAKTHHGASPTEYMRFAASIGRLFALKLAVTLLESTREVTSLPGLQLVSLTVDET